MLWSLAICFVTACSSGVYAQPVFCQKNDQCSEGYFCEKTAKICRECLRCQDFKREPSAHVAPLACIKSVADCGSCFKGLVLDHNGDVNAECVPPDGREEGTVLPAYVWVLIAIGLLLFGGVVVIVVYIMMKNPDTFKILASTRTSVRSPCYWAGEGAGAGARPNAPDPPPPYNPAHYTAVRPDSPSTFAPPPPQTQTRDQDTSQPFIKRAPPSQSQGDRESSDNQAARVYNRPAYLRVDEPPSSPIPASPNELDSDSFDNPFMFHDEDTTESTWTPHVGPNNDVYVNSNASADVEGVTEGASGEGAGAGAGGAVVPAGGAAGGARDAALAGPSPAKMLCIRQNKSRESNAGSGESNSGFPRSPSPTQSKPEIVFNINVQQINNSK